MRGFFKSLMAVLFIFSAFMVGFQLGKSKEKGKIPAFQEDTDSVL